MYALASNLIKFLPGKQKYNTKFYWPVLRNLSQNLCAIHVLPGSGIHHYFITYIYKEWDVDNSTGVESRWL